MNEFVAFYVCGATHVAISEDWSVYMIGTMNNDCSMNVMGEMIYDEVVIHNDTKIVDVRNWARIRPIGEFIEQEQKF